MNTDDLVNRLRREAAALRAEPSRDLAPRICAAIAAADRAAPSAGRAGVSAARLWVGWAALGGAAAAAIVGALLMRAPAAKLDSRAEAAALTQEMKVVPQRVWASVAPRAAAVLQQDPLRQEAAAIASDARSAAGFLAYNFLPTSRG